MALYWAVSERIHEWFPERELVVKDPRRTYDFVLIHPEDYGPWVDLAVSRLHPIVVNNKDEAEKVMAALGVT